MTDSMSLITAQISLLEPHLSIIHIPIKQYALFLQPLLRLLFGEDSDTEGSAVPWTNRHDFLNISITPIEISIICSRQLSDRYVKPVALVLNDLLGRNGHAREDGSDIGGEDYMVFQVDGQGLDAGQRVLELTSPLAMAGISIFFITTYFSDYIFVPRRARSTVTTALEQRGFVFSLTADAFVSQLSASSPIVTSPPSPFATQDSPAAPSTPPAKDVQELQIRTFKKLKAHNILPNIDRTLKLVSCAGSRESSPTGDEQLKNDLLQVLLASCPSTVRSQRITSVSSRGLAIHSPTEEYEHDTVQDWSARFLSITITATEPISILFEQRLVDRLGTSLLGAKLAHDSETFIPILFDLRDLPMEATGIVCGVAGRLAQESASLHAMGASRADLEEEEDGSNGLSPRSKAVTGVTDLEGPIEVSFLSTAKAGTVVVKADQIDAALAALEVGMEELARDMESL